MWYVLSNRKILIIPAQDVPVLSFSTVSDNVPRLCDVAPAFGVQCAEGRGATATKRIACVKRRTLPPPIAATSCEGHGWP